MNIIETDAGLLWAESRELLIYIDDWGVVPGYRAAAKLLSKDTGRKITPERIERDIEKGAGHIDDIEVRPATKKEVRAEYKGVVITPEDKYGFGDKRCPVSIKYRYAWGTETAHVVSMTRAKNDLGLSQMALDKIGNKLPGYKKLMGLLPDNVVSVIVHEPGWVPPGGWEDYFLIQEGAAGAIGKVTKAKSGSIKVKIPETVFEFSDFREIPHELLPFIR
jgi:hypothetical protein